jgi:hypothetical protein
LHHENEGVEGSTLQVPNSYGEVVLEPSGRFVQLKIVVMKD